MVCREKTVLAGALVGRNKLNFEMYGKLEPQLVSDGDPNIYLHRGRRYAFHCVYNTLNTTTVICRPRSTAVRGWMVDGRLAVVSKSY